MNQTPSQSYSPVSVLCRGFCSVLFCSVLAWSLALPPAHLCRVSGCCPTLGLGLGSVGLGLGSVGHRNPKPPWFGVCGAVWVLWGWFGFSGAIWVLWGWAWGLWGCLSPPGLGGFLLLQAGAEEGKQLLSSLGKPVLPENETCWPSRQQGGKLFLYPQPPFISSLSLLSPFPHEADGKCCLF